MITYIDISLPQPDYWQSETGQNTSLLEPLIQRGCHIPQLPLYQKDRSGRPIVR